MASRSDDTVTEDENLPESLDESIELPETSAGNWENFSTYSDLLEAYDTVVEVKNDLRSVEQDHIRAVDENVLMPGREAYSSEGESLERLAEELDGDTLVVAFGLRGEELPSYREVNQPDMYPEGNWWDEPEKLDADYLFDRQTYEGAVDPNGFESEPITQANGLDRGLYLFRNS